MTKKDAWGYVRLSQEGRDASLDEQKRAIRDYAREHGLNLQTTRNEGDRTSGFDSDRDEYQLLRQKIRDAEIDAVIVRDRARLSRDFDDRLSLLTDFRSANVEWHVVEVGGRLHVEDVQQAMFECIHAGMDHIKKQIEITRAKEATQERIDDGCYQGKPPLGLQFADDNCHLEKDEQEWKTVCDIIEARERGETYAKIAEDVGVSAATVSRVADRGYQWYQEKVAEYGLDSPTPSDG
jgi:DNA invertase Pin-like site-specific DNA recombinase